MQNVLIVAYLLIVLALITVILLQRSEGGGLGMGSTAGGLISVRGSANLLTRTTGILAALFFATAIALTILSGIDSNSRSILDSAADPVGEGATTPTTVLDALNQLQNLSAPTAPAQAVDPVNGPDLALPPVSPAPAPAPAPANN
jgi:preprotein translocase subunit SecG